jgi:hypothetical protein
MLNGTNAYFSGGFCSRSSEHWGAIQVGTPSFGSTHLFMTTHKTRIATSHSVDPTGVPPPSLSAARAIFYEEPGPVGCFLVIDGNRRPRVDVPLHVFVHKDVDPVIVEEQVFRVFRLIQSQSQAGTSSTHARKNEPQGRFFVLRLGHDAQKLFLCALGDGDVHWYPLVYAVIPRLRCYAVIVALKYTPGHKKCVVLHCEV